MKGAFYMNGVDMATLGGAGVLGAEAYPLTGMFNLPSRKGATEYNWGTEIEAFVEDEDIEIGGRTLTLTALVKGKNDREYQERLEGFKSTCIACEVLGSDFGDFNVIQRDDIGVTEYPWNRLGVVTVKFFEERVFIPALGLSPTGGSGILLDGFNLRTDLGIGVSEIMDSRNPGKRIEVGTTSTYRQTIFREKPTITLSCFMVGKDLVEIQRKMGQLSALCVKPGKRVLTLEDGTTLDVYCKDGITARVEHATAVTFDLKLRVI